MEVRNSKEVWIEAQVSHECLIRWFVGAGPSTTTHRIIGWTLTLWWTNWRANRTTRKKRNSTERPVHSFLFLTAQFLNFGCFVGLPDRLLVLGSPGLTALANMIASAREI